MACKVQFDYRFKNTYWYGAVILLSLLSYLFTLLVPPQQARWDTQRINQEAAFVFVAVCCCVLLTGCLLFTCRWPVSWSSLRVTLSVLRSVLRWLRREYYLQSTDCMYEVQLLHGNNDTQFLLCCFIILTIICILYVHSYCWCFINCCIQNVYSRLAPCLSSNFTVIVLFCMNIGAIFAACLWCLKDFPKQQAGWNIIFHVVNDLFMMLDHFWEFAPSYSCLIPSHAHMVCLLS